MKGGPETDRSPRAIAELLEVMARLRDPRHGCPWDVQQTFASIAPYTLEEAYEVADAIERGDRDALCGELGDLLFQVVFHARMAEERDWFDFDDVAAAIRDKLVRRHPHVFGDMHERDPRALARNWDEAKARERQHRAAGTGGAKAGTLADVPLSLPALSRATKLGRRAGGVGFDWPDAQGVRAKVHEELAELDAALEAGKRAALPDPPEPPDARQPPDGEELPDPRVAEELGDLLFALANLSRHLGVDAETALRAASSKFERRFARMEAVTARRGRELRSLSAEEWDALWNEAKSSD